jgi:DNA-binding CsgD family transcriptional regulator
LLIALGFIETPRDALSSFECRVQRVPSSWARGIAARCQGLLEAAQDDLTGAQGWFDTGLEFHREHEQPYELARTLLAQGATLRRARHHRRARTALTRARDLFEELHVSLWAERAREELERIGGRASSPHELTPAERRVSDLVATGLTNKQVAAELFISVHTVETQLSSAYAKLGVHSRTELTHRLMADRAIGRTG